MKAINSISVVICCYNSAAVIDLTLKHLAEQIQNGLSLEIVLVDNNCSDDTVSRALLCWEKNGSPFPLNVVKELKPGLSYAREKGILSATGDIILFCDDDNRLDAQYLTILSELFANDTAIGVVGGIGTAIPPAKIKIPYWFDSIKHQYATEKQNEYNGEVERNWVYGAGMAFRKKVYIELKQAGFKSLLSDRTGTSLVSGGDVELCLAIKMAGYKIWYDERLRFDHFIPEFRINQDYLKRLAFDKGQGNEFFKAYQLVIKERDVKNYRKNWIFVLLISSAELLWYLVKNKFLLRSNFNDRLKLYYRVGNLKHLLKIRGKIKQAFDQIIDLNHNLRKR